MDALEPSRGMLRLAEAKHVYRKFIQEALTHNKTSIQDGKAGCTMDMSRGASSGKLTPQGHTCVSASDQTVRLQTCPESVHWFVVGCAGFLC